MTFAFKDVVRILTTLRPNSRCATVSGSLFHGRHQSFTTSTDGGEDNASGNKDTKETRRRKAAKIKLNELLGSIKTTGVLEDSSTGSVSDKLARPGAQPRPRNVVRRPRTESSPAGEASPSQSAARKTKQTSKKSKQRAAVSPVDEELAQAARDVASTLGGDTDQIEMDLLNKLNGQLPRQQKPASADRLQLSDLLSNMRIQAPDPDRELGADSKQHRDRAPDASKSHRARGATTEESFSFGLSSSVADVDLNQGQTLGIFKGMEKQTVSDVAAVGAAGVWERVHQREMDLLVTYPPTNGWQEMIRWTEQGKLWTLPVDNEAGLEAEAAVGFHEHVFLDGELEPWCPRDGPVRHFMELVCVGLAKNPWLTVAEKHEHIAWFREYFDGKRELLQEVKAI